MELFRCLDSRSKDFADLELYQIAHFLVNLADETSDGVVHLSGCPFFRRRGFTLHRATIRGGYRLARDLAPVAALHTEQDTESSREHYFEQSWNLLYRLIRSGDYDIPEGIAAEEIISMIENDRRSWMMRVPRRQGA